MTPIVSIVLPVYNGARYLAEAVAAVRGQLREDWDLVIVDDASTDGTPDLIAGWAARDGRIRAIRHPANRKLPAALNTGLEAAQGKYLTWTSDDNRYRPAALAEMVSFLDRHPQIALVYADQALIDEDGRVVGHKCVGPPDQLGLSNCVGGCFLFRREVLAVIGGYREDRFLVEDYDFWLRLRAAFPIAPLHRTLYEYRHHAGSLTSTRRQQVFQQTELVVAEHLPTLRRAGRRIQANLNLQLAALAQRRGDLPAARRRLLAAARHSPWRAMRYLPGLVSKGLLGIHVRVVAGPAYRALRRWRRGARTTASQGATGR